MYVHSIMMMVNSICIFVGLLHEVVIPTVIATTTTVTILTHSGVSALHEKVRYNMAIQL